MTQKARESIKDTGVPAFTICSHLNAFATQSAKLWTNKPLSCTNMTHRAIDQRRQSSIYSCVINAENEYLSVNNEETYSNNDNGDHNGYK